MMAEVRRTGGSDSPLDPWGNQRQGQGKRVGKFGCRFEPYSLLAIAHPTFPQMGKRDTVSNEKLMDALHPEPGLTGDMREDLAALEHYQWAKAVAYVLDNMSPENLERWKRQIATPYAELSEQEKDSDRKWADRAIVRLGPKLEDSDAMDIIRLAVRDLENL
jgi:hypothetical protein